jgi:hypothetical protein
MTGNQTTCGRFFAYQNGCSKKKWTVFDVFHRLSLKLSLNSISTLKEDEIAVFCYSCPSTEIPKLRHSKKNIRIGISRSEFHVLKNIPNSYAISYSYYKITPHLANIWPTANNRKRGIAHDTLSTMNRSNGGVDRLSCLHTLCKPQYLYYEICNFKNPCGRSIPLKFCFFESIYS